jgi:MarR family transcriptional regulator for hemolysin
MSIDNKNPASARGVTESLGIMLHDAARLLRRRFEQNAAHLGLSSAQWRLLVRVFKEEGITQARLAELLEVEPISVSRLIDRMEEGGWIERRADPQDRRVRNIYLSQKSRTIFQDMRAVADEVFGSALKGVSPDQREVLFHCLKTIISNLSEPISQDDDRKAADDTKAA